MAGFYGTASKLIVGDALPASPLHVDFQSETMSLRRTVIDGNGLKGTRGRYAQRARPNVKRVGGNISWTPNPVELAYFLPKILGGTAVGTSYPLAETIPNFQTWVKKGEGALDLYQYNGCAVTRAVFSGSSQGLINLSVDVVGTTRTRANATATPAGTVDYTTVPFLFYEGTLTLSGTTQFSSFELAIDNAIDAERFLNSDTLVTTQPTDRNVTLSLTVPYGDYASKHPETLDAPIAGINGIIAFVSGNTSLTITFYLAQFDTADPVVSGRGEVQLVLSGQCRRDGVNPEIAVVLDHTA